MKLKISLKTGVAALTFAGAALFPLTSRAQLYFRPFGGVYVERWGDDDVGEPAPRYTSRRAVASILAREGFRLVGPLGRRGDQIVATGVNRVEGEMRFFVDPYEGRVIRGVPAGPPHEVMRAERERDDEILPAPRGRRHDEYRGEYVELLNGSRSVARELDRGSDDHRPRRAERPRRERKVARLREAPERQEVQRERLEPSAQKPETTKSEEAKPAEKPAETQAPKPARIVYPPPGQSTPGTAAPAPSANAAPPVNNAAPGNATVVPQPAPAAATPAQPSMPRTAQAAGGESRRAIVPPTTPAASSPTTAPKK